MNTRANDGRAQGRHAVVLGGSLAGLLDRPRNIGWCADCSRYAEMMSVDDAAIFAGVNSRMIFRRAESGVLHSNETRKGLLVICSADLHTLCGSLNLVL